MLNGADLEMKYEYGKLKKKNPTLMGFRAFVFKCTFDIQWRRL